MENITFCAHQNVFGITVERLPSVTSSVQLRSLQNLKNFVMVNRYSRNIFRLFG